MEEQKFLVIDDNADARALLVRTLRRKFPRAFIHEAAEAGTALDQAGTAKWDAIIAHRAGELDGASLVRALRAIAPDTPILGVSGIDRSAAMKAAGATGFLHYDAWLMLGGAVQKLLDAPKAE